MIYYDSGDNAYNTPEYVYDTRTQDIDKLSDFIASTNVKEEKKINSQKYKNSNWFGVADNLLKICEYYLGRFLHHKSIINSQLNQMQQTNPEDIDFLLLWLKEINSNNDSPYQDRNHRLQAQDPSDWQEYIVYEQDDSLE